MEEFKSKKGQEWLLNLLHLGPAAVTFTKADGTERVMKCSLKSDLVQHYEKKTDKVKVVNEDVLPVFDLDKQQWRSFRWDSIKRVEATI